MQAHALAVRATQLLVAIPPVRAAMQRWLVPSDPRLVVHLWGLRFPSPIGSAAGNDKDAAWFRELGLLGFGFVEVGTVTPRPQAPNPGQTVFRLVHARALINRMGFPNPGAAVVAARLKKREPNAVVGVNIGKGRDTAIEDAHQDYETCARELGSLADYVVLNVSSPNTPRLREIQSVSRLSALIDGVRAQLASSHTPLLIKVSPDVSDDELDQIADLAVAKAVDGIVAVNTTTTRDGVARQYAAEAGGLSGAPLGPRALAVLTRLYSRVGDRVPLISVGGIESAEDVLERMRAGASLVQGHTGFIYGGPFWPFRLNRQLSRELAAQKVDSIQALVGVGASDIGPSVVGHVVVDERSPASSPRGIALR